LIKQITLKQAQRPLIATESRSGRYPSSAGDVYRFDVPDEYVSFDVSVIAPFCVVCIVLIVI